MSIRIKDFEVKDIRFPTSRELHGSDAMNPDPDYSAAYVIFKTDKDGLEGHGLTFTIGMGNDLCSAAIQLIAPMVVAISGFMSLMFSTISGLASEGLGRDTKIGSSGLIMAIGGGAALPALQGLVSDMTGSIHISYWVPLLCFLVVALYGLLGRRYELAEG